MESDVEYDHEMQRIIFRAVSKHLDAMGPESRGRYERYRTLEQIARSLDGKKHMLYWNIGPMSGKAEVTLLIHKDDEEQERIVIEDTEAGAFPSAGLLLRLHLLLK